MFSRKENKMIINLFMDNVVKELVLDIRKTFESEFNIQEGCFKDYRGLSFDMCTEFKKRLEEYFNKNNFLKQNLSYQINFIQGYPSKHISEQELFKHTIILINILNKVIYVDLSCQEFKHIFPNIDDYYISTNKPKYLYIPSKYKIINNIYKLIFSKHK